MEIGNPAPNSQKFKRSISDSLSVEKYRVRDFVDINISKFSNDKDYTVLFDSLH